MQSLPQQQQQVYNYPNCQSLLEITEEDMIVMNVKRGHRRLIQREIATAKGIPRDQPLVTNVMGPKYSLDIPPSLKMEQGRGPNYVSSGYETLITGLTSPRSMNSGLGGSNTSGNSSSNNSGPLPNNARFVTPLPSNNNTNNNSKNNGSTSSSSSNGSAQETPLNDTNNNASNVVDTMRSISISSNDDNESVQSDSTAPKRKYRRHAKPDRNAPIKPPSAYVMFSNDARAKLKNQNLSFAELAKVVGDQWKNLSYYEKQAYERKATRAKDEYLAALEHYRQTNEYKKYQEYLKDFKAKQEDSNRMIEKARKRAKQKSPGSGSLADASSNGNSTGNGSSGSSGDNNVYGDKDISEKSSEKSSYFPSTNDYQDVEHYRHEQQKKQQEQQWNHRSDQMMRGMIPVEFIDAPSSQQSKNNVIQNVLAGNKHPLDVDSFSEKSHKRRSPRFRKSTTE
ncbi:hypothetical protein G6F57_008440 [Rhizopus arrhizus]|uniref:HMG box domain-containing protein n=1 Tax=Rhizopus oryzae TaxID=64495 RepID=A0A9P7BUJ5_RHIOR|nr:hypothetical protein G6F24_003020 [Rhizopus arrhizus]KAG1411051.1 hypothetical protein G6F58_008773 [Rhizopus delemar]KAG0913974.1 hypothetical protein G6F33_004674 [Rhizopus arrhizus]KAG0945142.1 hypothetical protein G6F30_004404 [Rhizopus arrhizus]KAG0956258.1 hypothetical protein G6F32_002175 [Rhizopus arrhizus]